MAPHETTAAAGDAEMMSTRLLAAIVCAILAREARSWSPGGFPNQLGTTPPRGWRSWIAYKQDADQSLMEVCSTHRALM